MVLISELGSCPACMQGLGYDVSGLLLKGHVLRILVWWIIAAEASRVVVCLHFKMALEGRPGGQITICAADGSMVLRQVAVMALYGKMGLS